MRLVQPRWPRSAEFWLRVGGLALSLLVSAGSVRAQDWGYRQPYGPWAGGQRDWAKAFEDFQNKPGEIARQQREAAARGLYEMHEASEREARTYRWNETAYLVLAAIVVALTLLSVVFGIYVRSSATTDPHKLAMSDPWLRAHLAQSSAAGGEDRTGGIEEAVAETVR